jgi:hypothetical protein
MASQYSRTITNAVLSPIPYKSTIVGKAFPFASLYNYYMGFNINTWILMNDQFFLCLVVEFGIGEKKSSYLSSNGFKTSFLNNSPRVDFGEILLASYISTLCILVASHYPP